MNEVNRPKKPLALFYCIAAAVILLINLIVMPMIAEKEVLAMYRAIVLPPATGFLDGLAFGMIIICKGDIVLTQIIQYGFFSCHDGKIFAKIRN